MKPSKLLTAGAVCLCLAFSAVFSARAQSADTARLPGLRALRAGAAFPYPAGVGLELSVYRRVVGQAALADTVIASKNRRIRALTAQVCTAEDLYQQATVRALAAEQAADRRRDLLLHLDGLDQKANRPDRWPLFFRVLSVGAVSFGAGFMTAAALVGR